MVLYYITFYYILYVYYDMYSNIYNIIQSTSHYRRAQALQALVQLMQAKPVVGAAMAEAKLYAPRFKGRTTLGPPGE